MTMPRDPVFGGGALRVPAVYSPNFDIAAPASSPANSWALLASGLAYLFGVTLTGGTITGPDYIINSAGAFFYSGTPATGNLLIAIAGAGGTDAFGNSYGAGVSVLNESTGITALMSSGQIAVYSGTTAVIAMTAPSGVATITFAGSSGTSQIVIKPDGHLQFSVPIECKDSAAPSAPTAGTKMYSATGHLKTVSEDGNLYTCERLSSLGPANQSVSATGFTALANMSAPIGVGAYRFRICLQMKANASAGQWELQLTGPATSALSYGYTWIGANASGTTSNITAFSTTMAGPATNVTGFYYVIIEGNVTTTAAGTLALAGATTATADTWNAFAGSSLELFPTIAT